MDGIQGATGVLVVGCTNRPLSELDPAMLRPGIYIFYTVAALMHKTALI